MVFCPLIWALRQGCPFFRQYHHVQSGTFWHRRQQQDRYYRNRNWYQHQDLSKAKIQWLGKFGALKNSKKRTENKAQKNTHKMTFKSEFCAGKGGCTAVIWCCHTTCNNGIGLVFKGIGQQEFQFSNFVASQCSTSVVIPFDEKFNIWICFVECFEIPWFDIGNTRHQLFSSQKFFVYIFWDFKELLRSSSVLWLY